MSATLVDGFYSASGEGKGYCLLEFWHIDTLLLEVGVLTHHTCGVKLGSTSSVGVASAHDRTLFVYWTNSCHSGHYSNIIGIIRQCLSISSSK